MLDFPLFSLRRLEIESWMDLHFFRHMASNSALSGALAGNNALLCEI